jgi:branched-chain amino acid transport system substrate-binding protein
MKLTKIMSVVLAAILCLSLFAACDGGNTDSGYTAENTEYVIGLSGPLTGGAAMYGEAVKNAAVEA